MQQVDGDCVALSGRYENFADGFSLLSPEIVVCKSFLEISGSHETLVVVGEGRWEPYLHLTRVTTDLCPCEYCPVYYPYWCTRES